MVHKVIYVAFDLQLKVVPELAICLPQTTKPLRPLSGLNLGEMQKAEPHVGEKAMGILLWGRGLVLTEVTGLARKELRGL